MAVALVGVKQAIGKMEGLAAKQAPFAMAKTMTSLVKGGQEEARGKFGRAKPAALRKIKPATLRKIKIKPATRAALQAELFLDPSDSGWDAPRTIGHLFRGGNRKFKRSEGQLQRTGILNMGDKTNVTTPKGADGLTGPQTVRLLSAVKGFDERGFRANMTAKRLAKLANMGTSESGYRTINGVVYFVSAGRRHMSGAKAWKKGRTNAQLHPGIWQKSGTHGVNVKPALIFIKKPRYRKQIDLLDIMQARVRRDFRLLFRANLENAMRTAR